MYTSHNFKTKKELMAAIKAGKKVSVYQPGPFFGKTEGRVTLEGPHFPAPHTWYVEAVVKDGYIVEVK